MTSEGKYDVLARLTLTYEDIEDEVRGAEAKVFSLSSRTDEEFA